MKKILIGSCAVIVVIILIVSFTGGGIPVRMTKVLEGPISSYVEERAMTSLPRVYKITMPHTGKIKPIDLLPGTPVKKGDIVAEMNTDDLKTALAEKEAAVETIKARIKLNLYNDIEKTAYKESTDWISTMKSVSDAAWKKSEAANAKNLYAQWYLESAKKMKTAISTKEFNQAQMEAATAKVEYESDLFSYKAVKMVETIFQLCPVYINQFLQMKVLNREILEMELKEAQACLQKAQRDLQKAILRSPVDGIILKRYFKNERTLDIGTEIMDIGNLCHLEVTADILSQEASGIKKGNPVDIYGGALEEEKISGTVKRVDPEGFTKVSSLGVEEQRVPVTVSIDEKALKSIDSQGYKIGIGYRLHVRIHTAEAQKALKIPRTAIFRGSGNTWKVFKVKGSTAELTDVRIGLKNDKEAQILKGLEKGDTVITAPPASLKDGEKVSVEDI